MPVGRLGEAARSLGRQPRHRLQCRLLLHSGLSPLMPSAEDGFDLINHLPCCAGRGVWSFARVNCSIEPVQSVSCDIQVSFLQTRPLRGEGAVDARPDRPSGYLDAHPRRLAGSGGADRPLRTRYVGAFDRPPEQPDDRWSAGRADYRSGHPRGPAVARSPASAFAVKHRRDGEPRGRSSSAMFWIGIVSRRSRNVT
jgi:hypothetical protein